MNRQNFFKAISNLRECISKQWSLSAHHNLLDNLVKTVIGDETMTQEQSLQDDVARIIKRIKEAKTKKELADIFQDIPEEQKGDYLDTLSKRKAEL